MHAEAKKRSPRRRKQQEPAPAIIEDPQLAAREAGLRYVTDAKPGIHRKRSGKGFRYVLPDGKPVKDEETLARIHALVIPPAWSDVWIAPQQNAHLQATGRDVRGRKQSRYHAKWRAFRDETKYARMTEFAHALPRIRETVEEDLKLPGLPKEKVLATVVSLMERTLIRVGNEEYARENKSFGLTTMRTRHVEVKGAKVTFSFQGKSRVHHTIDLEDRQLARIIRRCEDLPGYELFQYVDEEGKHHAIDSGDVNGYLQAISGEHFTAKDFRTWAGSVLAADILNSLEPFATATEAKKNVVAAIRQVASRLGNTPSVCRKCYVHPAVLSAYLDGKSKNAVRRQLNREIAEHGNALRHEEAELLRLLQQRMLLEAAG